MSYSTSHINGVTITGGNNKLGKIPNVSTLPRSTCNPKAPCFKGCYARKFVYLFPGVKRAWGNNTKIVREDRDGYFNALEQFLDRKHPKLFRFHVGGDIPDQDYLNRMKRLARRYPKTRFMTFTKQHGLDYRNMPRNLNIVFSYWYGWGRINPYKPIALVDDGKGSETRIKKGAFICKGACDKCRKCWNLKAGQMVVFHKH